VYRQQRRSRVLSTLASLTLGAGCLLITATTPAGAVGLGAANSAANSASNSAMGNAANSTERPAGPQAVDHVAPAVSTAVLTQTDRYILQFTPETAASQEAATHLQRGMAVHSVLTEVFSGEIADLTPAQVKALRLNPRVSIIEADTPVSADATQSPVTWGLDRIDQRNRPLSNSYSYDRTGSGVKAYVVDSGIAAHSDFGNRVALGSNAYSGVNDGRGTTDCDGHGTHVAGTIGGTTYGVAKAVTLVPVRVLDCSGGGTASGVINGLNWIIRNHAANAPAVANVSLGLPPNDLVDDAVRATIADGVTVVVAAGNNAGNACNRSPSRVTNALTVGAVDAADERAWFSNTGSCVDLFAPGVSITSNALNGSTAVLSGTSMATPHVAGAAALLLSESPSDSPATIATTLLARSVTGVLSEIEDGSPNRLLNTGAVLPLVTPAAPTDVRATTPTTSSTTVSWTRSVTPEVLDQTVNIYINDSFARSTVVPANSTSTSFTSLTVGQSYTFTVQARNALGLGDPSSPSTAVVYRTAPSTPSSLRATILTSGATLGAGSLTWSVTSLGGSPLLDQTVRTYRAGTLVATTTVAGTDTSFITPGALDLGVAYKFTVQARNAIGASSFSSYSNTITHIIAPSAPTSVAAVLRSSTNARVTWVLGTTASSTGGSSITEQSIKVYANGVLVKSITVGGSTRSFTYEELVIGKAYTFTVQARNVVGWGTASAPSGTVTRLR